VPVAVSEPTVCRVAGHPSRVPSARRLAAALLRSVCLLAPCLAAPAIAATPTVVDVPSRPAFVQPPGRSERPARVGDTLRERSLIGTRTPGRLQVRLADGRSLRLGGDAVLRLQAGDLQLEKGRLIAWIAPGMPRRQPLRIRTRSATAAILGTTVFVEVTPERERIFSWEGTVAVRTAAGVDAVLNAGEQILCERGVCGAPHPMPDQERRTRRSRSDLLNGFSAPMETLPLIDAALGTTAAP